MNNSGLASPQGWNRCAYVLNDPINRFDPAGTCGQSADTDYSVDGASTTSYAYGVVTTTPQRTTATVADPAGHSKQYFSDGLAN